MYGVLVCIKQTKEMPSQLAQETELKTHTRVQKSETNLKHYA